jgi:hypothetical protein
LSDTHSVFFHTFQEDFNPALHAVYYVRVLVMPEPDISAICTANNKGIGETAPTNRVFCINP